MDWEQKLLALQALARVQLCMRSPGDWYVSTTTEIKNGSILDGRYGNGKTPEAAVVDHWKVVTALDPHEYLVVNAHRKNRRAVTWNGFMWTDVVEPDFPIND